ncbi:hypothetical protein QAD02_010755 [Eretmocerus hayati]|uniref:Uncharacterized protein n=1 Tax=Eretmocerus hayati TaxID=131215 RepID=A0ACC2NV42_9HYME|nr:hypothetical protein QAD02_010755 [Eretmocerus hayati]
MDDEYHGTDSQDQAIKNQYLEFLDDGDVQGIYTNLVKNMIEEKKYRLVVNINDLCKRFPERANSLLDNAFDEIPPFQNALKCFVQSIDAYYAKGDSEFFIGFEGSFGARITTPRTLTSIFLGKMVSLEGIVARVSLVRPKVVKSVHYCRVTQSKIDRLYSDITSFNPFADTAAYPLQDEDGNPLETEFGLSIYKDHQTLLVQEMPEKSPVGQLPRSVEVICDDDLVDQCKPGDRVQIVGCYRCLPNKKDGYTSGSFRAILIANNIAQLSKEPTINISHDDVNRCKRLAKNNPAKDIFELLSKSLAPSIFGHEYVKKAILCMLLGGNEKILPNNSRLRGDINVLLVGDPSVAKTALLRNVSKIGSRVIKINSRGYSGGNLTAAVTIDPETNEKRLEAGAMVMADRGVICIDEFDKMSDTDRTAIHEVMEQGKVTIAKAGIHASLNARCSVLAAANPVWGQYNQYKTPMENICMQDSLLNRFDLVFVMLDTIDSEIDHVMSDHVVRMMRYRNPKEQEGEALPFDVGLDFLSTKYPDAEEIEKEDAQIYETYDPLLHGKSRKKSDQILTVKFLRKYIHIARCMKPKLTEEACELITEEYSRLRSADKMYSDVAKTQPVTARTLETLIRVSTAHAKARLSKYVEEQDAAAAIEIVHFAYFMRVFEKDMKRRRIDSNVDSDLDQNEAAEYYSSSIKQIRKRTKKNSPPGRLGRDPFDYSEEEDSDAHIEEARVLATSSQRLPRKTIPEQPEANGDITEDRLNIFTKWMHEILQQRESDNISIDDFRDIVNAKIVPAFEESEINKALEKLQDRNLVMVIDRNILLI